MQQEEPEEVKVRTWVSSEGESKNRRLHVTERESQGSMMENLSGQKLSVRGRKGNDKQGEPESHRAAPHPRGAER